MKKITSFLLMIVLLVSCIKKTDDDFLNQPCIDSCTIIKGRFLTGNNEALVNIPLEIQSQISPGGGIGQQTVRRIATGNTDNNGFFNLSFSLAANEYGPASKATLILSYSFDQSKYTTPFLAACCNESIGLMTRKDTTINVDLFLTTRAKLKIRLENYTPLAPTDRFIVISSCLSGRDKRETDGSTIAAAAMLTEQELNACGNESTRVFIKKRKNGVDMDSDTTVLTPVGGSATLVLKY
jgi:hypothetical protein